MKHRPVRHLRAPRARPIGRRVRGTVGALAAMALGALGYLAAPALAAASLEVAAEPLELTVGDRVAVTLSLVPPVGGAEPPSLPTWASGRWGEAEVLEVGEVRQIPGEPGETRYVQELVVTLFQTGVVELPAITLDDESGGAVRSDPLELTVRSILPAQEAEAGTLEARPPASLRQLPRGRAFWSSVLLLSTLGLVASAMLLSQRRVLDVIAPKIDPLDQFERFARSLEAEGDPVAFHTQLSFALRRFLGSVLGFPAVESTTTEIRERLRQHHLQADTVRHASQLLRDCDQVKFARLLAGRRDPGETLGEAGRLARDVYRDVRPTDAGDEGSAA